MVKVHVTLAFGAIALAGCGAGIARYGSADDVVDLEPRPVASVSGKLTDEPEITWSPRGGVVAFLGTKYDMPARPTLGGYARLLDGEAYRVELGFDVTPDVSSMGDANVYMAFVADFACSLGSGPLVLKAGGGGAFEFRGGDRYAVGLVECGVGLWVPRGKRKKGKAFVANMTIQMPLGEVNPEAMLALTAGYEH